MELIQNYSSDSDSQEEDCGIKQSESTPTNNHLPAAHSPTAPAPPPPILIFSQQYQNMHSAAKVAALFTYIPWTPSVIALAQLEKAVSHAVSQFPDLSNNYKFIAPNKDPFRIEKHHITIFPALNVKKEVETQFIDHMRERIAELVPPASLIAKPSGCDQHSPLSKILYNSKPSIRLNLENRIIIGRSPLKESLFCILNIKQSPETSKYLADLVESCKESARDFNAQLQFPELLDDAMHVSIATGYNTRRSLTIDEIDKINQQLRTIDVSPFTKDIQIAVNELTIQNAFEKKSTSIALV
ncbi:hypothetical protein CANMA_002463 [Candida margitis]|uniref:uncharacterized protein n=1 Tax=Candida margitis TaxID=1775924 RepID=UPI0022278B35|nr:uncharacterized protein CANMA_002463 [Candida margitis]KAI5968247.1 hypothetical protein CANMA_002463 [Candida margitis]